MLSFTFTLFSYLATSYFCARKINKEKYLSLWLILFFVFILLSVEILGIFNVFSSWNLLKVALIFLAMIFIFEFRNFKKFTLRTAFPSIKITNTWWIWLIFVLVIVVYSEFFPIAEIDSVAYHLPIVSTIISTKGFWEPFHAGFVGPNTFFPANHEAIQAFFAVQNGTMNFGYIVTFLSFLLLYSSLLDLGRKKVSQLFIFVVALSAASTPFLFNQFSNLQIDLFMFCLFGSAIALLLSSLVNDDKHDLAKSFLVFGILLGSKYNAVPQIAAVIPLIILVGIYFRKSLKSIFWYPVLSIVPGFFWYIRNWIIAGNPIYPFGLNLGFINFEGHKAFMENTVGTSLWNFMVKDGIASVFSHILSNDQFEMQLGKISLLLMPLGLLAAIGVLIFIIFNKKNDKKSAWIGASLIVLLIVWFAEIAQYLALPYTYTRWPMTLRYAGPIFALIPLFFIISALYSRKIYITIFAFASGILAYNIAMKSFIFNADYWQLISEKARLIPIGYTAVLILMICLMVLLVHTVIHARKLSNTSAFLLLLIISFAISAQQYFFSPHFIKNTALDDQFLSKKLNIYPSILPHVQKLRTLKKETPEKIALTGLTPYWLFEKEGFAPIYVNIDGCLACQYFDYRNEKNSIRTNPDALKWKNALKKLDVKYLIVDFASYAESRESYEENWAKSDEKMFTPLLKTDSVSLYRINF